MVLLLCIFMCSACISPDIGSNNPSADGQQPTLLPTERPTQSPTVQVTFDRLPNLPERYDDHLLLKCKGVGACDSLTGTVMMTVIMVEDDKSVWTEDALAVYKQKLEAQTQALRQEAKTFGADLSPIIRYETCRITGTVSMSDCEDWVKAAIAAVNLPAPNEVIPHLKQRYNVKEAPVVFCVNYPGRAFSIEWNQGDYFEYSVLFSDPGDYRHELNHLFGAIDFYSPDIVKELSDRYLPDSIMSAVDNQITDSLTAYLIGWTDTVSDEAWAFIDETAWLTQEYLDEQLRLQILTGHGSIRWGDGTYTGDLVSGIPNGQGKILWDNGNTYEGGWQNGVGCGYGVCHWYTDCCSYAGEWVDWKMTGYGTYTYSDGTTKTGLWENGNYIGK